MSMPSSLRSAAIAAALSVSLAAPAFATQEDRVDCYAQVHESCFPGGGDPQCSQQDYNDALDICDTYATDDGNSNTQRPRAPANKLAGPTSQPDPGFIVKLKAELKRKYSRR